MISSRYYAQRGSLECRLKQIANETAEKKDFHNFSPYQNIGNRNQNSNQIDFTHQLTPKAINICASRKSPVIVTKFSNVLTLFDC